jgi:LacI family transcriptional regulator
MRSKNIKLKDVAQSAKVSVSTVSRVINKEKFVSDEVKRRVNKAIKELNYQPEWVARSLRLGKTDTIGVIIPNISDYFLSSIVLGVEKFFFDKGKDIILFNTRNDEKIEERAIKLAFSKRVDGIIISTICKNEKIMTSLMESFGIPIVIVDNKLNIKNIDQVLCDDINGSVKIMDHLIKVHGYKAMACISGPFDESSGLDKFLGYKKALIENGIKVDMDYVKVANWQKKLAYEYTKELLGLKKKPEAIYCTNSNMLIGCLRYLIEKNVKVPEDIALVTFDDYDFVSVLCPPVTSLERIDIKMGEIAAELLFNRIQKSKEDFKEIRLNPELIIRRSCGCNQHPNPKWTT